MLTGIDPKVDFAFKWLFSREASKHLLIDLLHAILLLPAGQEIIGLEILNPFTEKSMMDDKYSILDIKAKDARGRYFNIEMQMIGLPAALKRILFYWGKVYTEQLGEGDAYRLLKPTVSICFVDSVLLHAVSDYHTRFQITERDHGIVLTDDLEIHIFELPKFNKSSDEILTALDRWLYFLRNAPKMDGSHLPASMDTPAIRQAMETLMILSQTQIEREIYEGRVKMRRDEISLQEAFDEGMAERDAMALRLAEALEEAARASEEAARASEEAARASEEGLGKGRLMGQVLTLQSVLGQEPTPEAELLAMNPDDLRQLAERLSQQFQR